MWRDYYETHKMTAAQAIAKVRDGDRIVTPMAMAETTALNEELVAQKERFTNVEICNLLVTGAAPYCAPGMESHFRYRSSFLGGPVRKAFAAGMVDFIPCVFSKVPSLFTDGYLPVDVAFISVTPPDRHGYVSLGISVEYQRAAVESAKLVIAQVNAHMPRTHGDSFFHVTEIDCFVEQDKPLQELERPELTDIERQIGKYCASLIEDGATLQLGIGNIPDAVLLFLKQKKDLGIHTEMFSDGVVELVEAGVVTNRKKTLHPGKIVSTFLMGSKKLYDFVDDNPGVMMLPVDYVNNPYVIGQNDNMISINSCVQVDLHGQVASETIGMSQISGIGGQVDFIRGAAISKGGKSILAFPSGIPAKGISKIVPLLDTGATVTTSRTDVHYFVTEYGIADMRGKSLADRARALIGIAHPDFRPMLIEEWERRFKRSF